MISDELWNSLPDNGWLKRDEADMLLEVAEGTEGSILEVGCYYGRSTIVLASLHRPVYSVDPFSSFDDGDPSGDRVCEAFKHNLRDRCIHNVMLFRTRIEDWVTRPVGFAYLDGDHTHRGTINQILLALDCGTKELCLHDYDTNGGGLEILRAIRDTPIDLVRVVGTMAHCRSKA